jgi:hypothetical protein
VFHQTSARTCVLLDRGRFAHINTLNRRLKEQEKHGAAKREDSWVHPINNFAWRHHEVNIWLFVLKSNNVHRQSLVDQVIAAAVSESPEPQKTSVAVKAFFGH